MFIATSTTPSRGLAPAMASLIVAAAGVSGQIIFIPTSSFAAPSTPRGLFNNADDTGYFEPPCRQRRLEPFRQRVREECRLEASVYCSWENPGEIRDLATTASIKQQTEQMASLFDAIFSPSSASSLGGGDHSSSHESDPFQRIFDEIIGYSLRAFDESAAASSTAQHVFMSEPMYKEPPDKLVNVAMSTVDKSNPNISTVDAEDESAKVNAAPVAQAEHALDFAVAELARRTVNGGVSVEGGDITAPPALPNVDELHDRLFRFGSGLISETIGKRRLTEDDADPRAHVKERLARRLTEYRTDLFYHPDGSVTVYTRSLSPNSSTTTAPPLGTGSNRVDECLNSRYANGDLGGGCHDAVGAFTKAIAPQMTAQSYTRAHGTAAANANIPQQQRTLDVDRSSEPFVYGACGIVFMNLVVYEFYSIVCMILAVIVDRQFASEDDDEQDDEGATEFEYKILPESDGKVEIPPNTEGATVPRVYVGVPIKIQVV